MAQASNPETRIDPVFRIGKNQMTTQRKYESHGMTNTSVYNTWANQKNRCNNPKNWQFKNYGRRGIKFSKKLEKFTIWYKYIASLKNAMLEGYTLDRKDNDGNYEEGNLRWVTQSTQLQNTRKLQEGNTSGYRGVTRKRKKWQAQISVDKKRIYLGIFDYPWTAAMAYDSYVIIHQLEHTRNTGA